MEACEPHGKGCSRTLKHLPYTRGQGCLGVTLAGQQAPSKQEKDSYANKGIQFTR